MFIRPYPGDRKLRSFRVYRSSTKPVESTKADSGYLLTYPLLTFLDDDGHNFTEYIPVRSTIIASIYYDLKVKMLYSFGWDVYYGDVRHYNSPYYKKLFDLALIDHVLTDHDGGQGEMERAERLQFKRIYRLYEKELKNVEEFKHFAKYKMHRHPYVRAYDEHWRVKFIPEAKSIYHGLKYPDMLECLIQVNDALIRTHDRK